MELMNCSKDDFDQILTNIEEFWGSGRTLHLQHTMFINEFGNTAFVLKEGDGCMRLPFWVLFPDSTIAYVHLIAVRNNYRDLRLGRKLYERFIECAREKHCLKTKAITKPTNLESIEFHKSIGMDLTGNGTIDGIPVIFDYCGPGEYRIVFVKDI